jgi:hypothetical protein
MFEPPRRLKQLADESVVDFLVMNGLPLHVLKDKYFHRMLQVITEMQG